MYLDCTLRVLNGEVIIIDDADVFSWRSTLSAESFTSFTSST